MRLLSKIDFGEIDCCLLDEIRVEAFVVLLAMMSSMLANEFTLVFWFTLCVLWGDTSTNELSLINLEYAASVAFDFLLGFLRLSYSARASVLFSGTFLKLNSPSPCNFCSTESPAYTFLASVSSEICCGFCLSTIWWSVEVLRNESVFWLYVSIMLPVLPIHEDL